MTKPIVQNADWKAKCQSCRVIAVWRFTAPMIANIHAANRVAGRPDAQRFQRLLVSDLRQLIRSIVGRGLTTALELRAQALNSHNPSFHCGLPIHQSVHGPRAGKARQLQALVRRHAPGAEAGPLTPCSSSVAAHSLGVQSHANDFHAVPPSDSAAQPLGVR